MELPSQEGHMPLPLNSAYGGGHTHIHGHVHMIHHDQPSHNHIMPSSTPPPLPPPPPPSLPPITQVIPSSNGPIGGGVVISSSSPNIDQEHVTSYKKMVRYKECLKNHAASMGGNATDGCGEFMPSGDEGSLEALTCSACNCHRNFHRKEIEGELISSYDNNYPYLNRVGRKMIMGHHLHQQKGILGTESLGGYPTTGALVVPTRVAQPQLPPHHPMIMSYNIGSMASESDEQDGGGGGGGVVVRPSHMVKKRHRTKFTQEQKEKMFNFAENSGWKIQKQEESVVQQFCQEIGVRRRVLKVWMHNNKHNLAKKNISDAPSQVM